MRQPGIGRISSCARFTSQMAKKKKTHITIGDNETSKSNKVNEANDAPENWERLYNNILEMRKEKNAPVDTMGCEKIQDLEVEPKVHGYFKFKSIKKVSILDVLLGSKTSLLGFAYVVLANQR